MSQHLRPQLSAIWHRLPNLLSAARPAASLLHFSAVAVLLTEPMFLSESLLGNQSLPSQ